VASDGVGAPVLPAVAARRFAAQLLTERVTPIQEGQEAPVAAVTNVVGRILAVQAQDLRAARLAVRSRSEGLTAADVDRALAERRLVVTWLNRGTLHLVRAEDYALLRPLTAPRHETAIRRRLADEGLSSEDSERGVVLVEQALADAGPLTRGQLRDVLAAAGIPTAGPVVLYLLGLASLRGVLVRGPMVGTEQACVLTRDWLGPAAPTPADRGEALAELAARYLAGHGPADDRDLATWAGIPLRDARRGISLAVAAGRAEQGAGGRADLRGRGEQPEGSWPAMPPARLLGPFDPVVHGWATRDWVTGNRPGLVTANGIFRPITLVAGQAAGTWGLSFGRVELTSFGPLPPDAADALRTDAADVERFLAQGVG
jgi:hypothetical protein